MIRFCKHYKHYTPYRGCWISEKSHKALKTFIKALIYRIRLLSEQLEDQSCKTPSLEEVSLKSELMKQKQEMIDCLQDELIKVRGNFPREIIQLLSQVRLREAENEEIIKNLRQKVLENEEVRTCTTFT